MSQDCRRLSQDVSKCLKIVGDLSQDVSKCLKIVGVRVANAWRLGGECVAFGCRFVGDLLLLFHCLLSRARVLFVMSFLLAFYVSLFRCFFRHVFVIFDIRLFVFIVRFVCVVCSIVLHLVQVMYVELFVSLACLAQSMVIVAGHVGHEGHACSGYTCDGGGGQST